MEELHAKHQNMKYLIFILKKLANNNDGHEK